MGTGLARNFTRLRGFSRADRSAPDTARAAVLYGAIVPISGQADSRMKPLTKKRELFPGLPPTSPTSFALPHVAPRDQSPLAVLNRARMDVVHYVSNF
ncbi:hypothetical protein BgiBS90_038439 [Biomphalaria glabrata]|nr:hypothetical protein BgiBS90_038439 [Biomphalaria glabrata]